MFFLLVAAAPATAQALSPNATTSDFNGDGKTDIATWRPSNGWWNIPATGQTTPYGVAGDIPVSGDYNGDGKIDIATYRPSNATWNIPATGQTINYGQAADIPVQGDYNGDGKTDIATWRPSNGWWNIPATGQTIPYGQAGDIPVPGDYNGDGKTDIATWRPSNGNWSIPVTGQTINYGVAGDVPVPADYNGDGKTDIATFRPSNGNWSIPVTGQTINYGVAGDVPVPGDYNGDDKDDIATFRPSNSTWSIPVTGQTINYGAVGDIPIAQPIGYTVIKRRQARVAGDFTGDGKTDLTVWKPSTGLWSTRLFATTTYGVAGDVPVSADYDGDGFAEVATWRPSNGNWSIPRLFTTTPYGVAGDIPVPGDYNGDGATDIATWRPSNGNWSIPATGQTINYGVRGDVPVPGDYNGDGKTDIATWRPSNATWSIPATGQTIAYGQDGDIPVPADYNGDGKTDIATYRPSNATWNIPATSQTINYGQANDIPVPGDYNGDGTADIATWRPSNGTWNIPVTGQTVAYGVTGDIPTPRPIGALSPDTTKPTITLSGGAYDARNQASMTSDALTVSANDDLSGVAKIVVRAGTVTIASTSRSCGTFMCPTTALNWSTSFQPGQGLNNWPTGVQHLSVEVTDNAGNVQTLAWDVQYYQSSWTYGGANHAVDNATEVQQYLEDLPSSSTEYTDTWNESALWTGLAVAEQDYVMEVALAYPLDTEGDGGFVVRSGVDLFKFGIVSVKLTKNQALDLKYRLQQAQVGTGACAAIAQLIASYVPTLLSKGAALVVQRVCVAAGLSATWYINEINHDVTDKGIVVTAGVKVTALGFPNPLPKTKLYFNIDPWN